GTKRAEFICTVEFIPAINAGLVNFFACFLLQPRMAAVGDGLVERLKVFERWLIAFVRGCAEVFVKPPMRSAPGFGLLLARATREEVSQQRMCVEGDEFAGPFRAVHREKPRVFQSLERQVPLRLAEANEQVGQPGDGRWLPQGSQAIRRSGTVEQSE